MPWPIPEVCAGYMEQQEHKEDKDTVTPGLATKNRRTVIILALVAVAIYIGFILLQMK